MTRLTYRQHKLYRHLHRTHRNERDAIANRAPSGEFFNQTVT